MSSSASRTLTGGAASDYFGFSVSGAGDVNGDGYDDVIIGALSYDSGTLSEAGAAYIHHGSSSGVSSSASRTLTGGAAGDYFGASVSGAGDVNGDGYDDVIVGTPYEASASLIEAGAAYIHHGSSSGVSSSASRTLTGGAAGDEFGRSVSGAGDVNGDGYADVLIGAPYYDSGFRSDAGAAYIHQGYTDEDGDGASVGGDSTTPQDCDDGDPAVGVGSSLFVDADGDGYGSTLTVVACPGDAGASTNATDCDDTRADVNPGATEQCDAANTDEDCDGLADDGDPSADPSGFSTFYADTDADGFGTAASPTRTCDQPAAHVPDSTDCDDTRATVSPAAAEVCDPGATDENCNGLADDADGTVDPESQSRYYADVDRDGFGEAGTEYLACSSATGAPNDLDCDDTRADVNPAATDAPDDGVDQDCDGADATDGTDGTEGADGTDGTDGSSDATSDGGGAGKSGCSTAPASPLPWLGALFALPALFLRRRRGQAPATASVG